MDIVYTLVFWIASCYGAGCPVATYEVKYFDNEQECEEIALVWEMASKDNEAVCIEGTVLELEYHDD